MEVDFDSQIPNSEPLNIYKVQSYNASQTKIYTMLDVLNKQLPMKIKKAREILCLDSEDEIITILRHFDWKHQKMEERWFDDDDDKEYKIGLKLNPKLMNQYPEINASLAANNDNMCAICYVEFEENDPLYSAVSLNCGHQYCSNCWGYYLRDKVASNGPQCVFTTCPQLRCNVVVPHSLFLKYLEDKPFEDGINYREKYNLWHCKQFTDHNSNIKWCP